VLVRDEQIVREVAERHQEGPQHDEEQDGAGGYGDDPSHGHCASENRGEDSGNLIHSHTLVLSRSSRRGNTAMRDIIKELKGCRGVPQFLFFGYLLYSR